MGTVVIATISPVKSLPPFLILNICSHVYVCSLVGVRGGAVPTVQRTAWLQANGEMHCVKKCSAHGLDPKLFRMQPGYKQMVRCTV